MKFDFKIAFEYLSVVYNISSNDVLTDVAEVDFETKDKLCLKTDWLMIKNNTRIDNKACNNILENIDTIVKNLNNKQKIIMFTSDAFLTSKDKNLVKIKEKLKESYIEEVIQTSQYGNFYKNEHRDYQYYPNSAVVLVLKKNIDTVRFVNNLGWVYDEPGLGESNFKEVVINKKVLTDVSNLLPSYLILMEETKKYNLKLKDLADVRQGCYINRILSSSMPYEFDETRDGDIFKPVEIKNISETILTGVNYSQVSKKSAKLDKHFLKKGDIVLTVKAANIKAAIVDVDASEKYIASNNLIVISPKSGVAPELILGYLQSGLFNSFVCTNIVAEYVKKLNVEQLKNAPIPLNREEALNSEGSLRLKKLIETREGIVKNIKGLSLRKDEFREEVNSIF